MTDRTPQQIDLPVTQHHVVFPIDRTGGLDETLILCRQIAQAHHFAIATRASASLALDTGVRDERVKSHSILLWCG